MPREDLPAPPAQHHTYAAVQTLRQLHGENMKIKHGN